MAPQSVTNMMTRDKYNVTRSTEIVDAAKGNRFVPVEQREGSTKVTKVRQGGGFSSILSTVGNRMFRRKQAKRAGRVSPQFGRSIVARMRGYFAGASGVRGVGRDTGTVNPFQPSSRADASKIAARSRPIPVGVFVPKVGG